MVGISRVRQDILFPVFIHTINKQILDSKLFILTIILVYSKITKNMFKQIIAISNQNLMNILNVMIYKKLTMLNISIIQSYGFKAINKHKNAKNVKTCITCLPNYLVCQIL